MTLVEQLKTLLNKRYESEDGEEFTVELLPGLSDQEIDEIAKQLPGETIPPHIRELFRFAKGFTFYGLDEVSFDGVGMFGFEELFPSAVQLAGDGFGNFWIVDIDAKGHWGNVFYVCHDPAVVVKHSDDLSQFLQHVDEYGKDHENAHLNMIHEKIVHDIWKKNSFSTINEAKNAQDSILNQFVKSLPDNFVIADLRNAPNTSGFAWGRQGPRAEIIKCDNELIWAIRMQKSKGFFSRMFGKKKE